MRFNLDLYAENLMLPEEELRAKKVEEQTIGRLLRLRDVYNFMLRNPLRKDREYIDYIQSRYQSADGKPLTRRTAYEDLEILHAVVGNLQQCSREWHRWRFNSMIMEGYALAVRKEDAAAIARLATAYGKFNQSDHEEHAQGYGEIPHIRFTFDVSVLGFKPIPNVRQVMDRWIAHYSHTSLQDIAEDAEIVEMVDAVDERKQEITRQITAHADTAAVS